MGPLLAVSSVRAGLAPEGQPVPRVVFHGELLLAHVRAASGSTISAPAAWSREWNSPRSGASMHRAMDEGVPSRSRIAALYSSPKWSAAVLIITCASPRVRDELLASSPPRQEHTRAAGEQTPPTSSSRGRGSASSMRLGPAHGAARLGSAARHDASANLAASSNDVSSKGTSVRSRSSRAIVGLFSPSISGRATEAPTGVTR